ncbi:GNAT family N-acetyltransferase [Paraliomyxa miuraensis]|uniref:GNAT family N-acetyltransferase n=1 Tax=Paraliomyxa miuraensis TaxID=376150 RepID=UPI0022539C73|nr:GNAT family protein [Paraliomyxa miuraensis]MCX4241212.1 GNAT family N-acetyltransferase [Paraliomyxa miuraensis]
MNPDVPLPTTTSLRMRRFGPGDLPAMVAYRSNPDVARYQSWTEDWSMADAEEFLRNDQAHALGTPGTWTQIALEERGSGVLVGDLALHFVAAQPDTVELGVTLAPAHQGRGLATEALRAMIAWLFEHHGTHRVLAQADARNVAVRGLLQRVGMRQEAELREADFWKGEWTTLCIYAVLAREWSAGAT